MAYSDGYENDNEYLYSRRINIGTTQTHSLPAGDIDWVFFDVTTPGEITLETTSSGDTTIYLYEYKNGFVSYIGWDDDSGTGYNAKLTTTLAAGRYTARIAGYSTSTTIDTYNITLTQNSTTVPTVFADTHEDDNSRFKAKKLTVGSTQSHTLHSSSDEDWIKFTVEADGFYTIQTTGGDTVLQMYSFENQAFGYNDDRGNGDFTSANVTWLYKDTTYYARLGGYNGKTFSYYVSVTSGVVADTYESNNDNTRTGTTSTLKPGDFQKHTIHSSSDVDWIKVDIATSGAYAFIVSTIDLEVGFMDLQVYDASGNFLASDSGENPFLYSDNLAAGTYYMRMAAAESGAIAGQYHAIVCQNDVTTTTPDQYEDDDVSSRAHRITTGETQTRSISRKTSSSGEITADVDWVYFEPTVTGTYNISVYGASAPLSATLYTSADDEDGLFIPVSGGVAENYLIAGMRYYLKVESDYSMLNVAEYHISANLVSTYTPEADAYENDNTTSTAQVITAYNPQAHSLHTSSDVDWVRFTPATSGYYTFYTGAKNGNAGDGDLMIGLYDASGTLLAYDDDSFSGYNPMVSYNMTAGQTYYAVVMSARTNQVVPYYTLSVEQGIIWDSYDIYMDERSEDDNTMERAVTHELGKAQTHTIHAADDMDWACFSVDSTGNYTIQTSGNGDTLLYVYDEDGNFIKMDDDSGVGRNASVTLTMQAGRWYYARVTAYGNALIPSYTLALTEASGGVGDAYESDNTAATASGIVAGETQSHSIHVAGDVDWVRLRPIQSGTYQIQTSGDADMKLDLYAANGTSLLASDDDSGVGLNARIGYELNANTDYYIRAYTYSSRATVDNYGLSVALMVASELGDEYENDDSPTNAKPLTVGSTQTHSIHISGDVDWVTFTPTVSAEYTIQTVGSGLNCDTQLYLYSSLADAQAGRYLQWDDDGGADRNALISRVLTAGTTYYIKAKAWSTYTIPSYGLKVTQNNGAGAAGDVNQDEYENDNLSGDCKPIAVGREYTHSIHRQSDTDWVRFFTHQTGTYTIQTTGASDMSFIVYKRIPGGALVPYEGGAEITSGGIGNNAAYRVNLETDNWYYVRVTTAGRQTTSSSYGIRVDIDSSSVQGDPYETSGGKPNDNAASRATWLTANSSQVHSIHTPGDQDWFAFKSTVSAQYTITLNHTGLYLYQYRQDEDGNLVYITRTGAMGLDNTSEITVEANTTYYFKVTATSPTVTIAGYTIGMSLPTDSYEDDNTSAKATLLTLGASQGHNLHTSEDVDWVKFTVSATGNYWVGNDNSGNISMVLYRSEGSSNIEVGRSSTTQLYNNLTAGTYYIRMASARSQACDGYSVTVSRDTSVQADAYESDNTRSTASSLSLSQTQTHSLHTTSDVDFVKFYATAGCTYTVSTVGNGLSLQVQNASGNTVKSTSGNNPTANFTASSSGYYYARISSANSAVVESYSVKAEQANEQENYAILFNGGGSSSSNYCQYYLGLVEMYETLVNECGLKPENIYILSADGLNPALDQSLSYYKTTTESWYRTRINSDYSFATDRGTSYVESATQQHLTDVVAELADIMDSNDHLLFWATDHGSDPLNSDRNYYTEGNESIAGWSGDFITSSEFNQIFSELENGYQTFLFSTCFSGGILNALDMESTSTRQRWGAASAGQGEFGWSGCSSDTDHYDENLGGYVASEVHGWCVTNARALAAGVTQTHGLGTYLLNNAPYICNGSYTNNNVCSEHYGRDYCDTNDWEDSDCVSHPWSTGSNFQIFAQA